LRNARKLPILDLFYFLVDYMMEKRVAMKANIANLGSELYPTDISNLLQKIGIKSMKYNVKSNEKNDRYIVSDGKTRTIVTLTCSDAENALKRTL
jgi:hypothetical protein